MSDAQGPPDTLTRRARSRTGCQLQPAACFCTVGFAASQLSRDVGVDSKAWNLPPKLVQFPALHGPHPGQTPSNDADNAESTRITGESDEVLPRPYRYGKSLWFNGLPFPQVRIRPLAATFGEVVAIVAVVRIAADLAVALMVGGPGPLLGRFDRQREIRGVVRSGAYLLVLRPVVSLRRKRVNR
jgi:hypothetical protein